MLLTDSLYGCGTEVYAKGEMQRLHRCRASRGWSPFGTVMPLWGFLTHISVKTTEMDPGRKKTAKLDHCGMTVKEKFYLLVVIAAQI
jgi:hypothetical protein